MLFHEGHKIIAIAKET